MRHQVQVAGQGPHLDRHVALRVRRERYDYPPRDGAGFVGFPGNRDHRVQVADDLPRDGPRVARVGQLELEVDDRVGRRLYRVAGRAVVGERRRVMAAAESVVRPNARA